MIYSSNDEFRLMNEESKWRYVNYKPPKIDFTWEREWRIKIEHFVIAPQKIVVIVPTRKHAEQIMETFGNSHLTLSLSILGRPSNWS